MNKEKQRIKIAGACGWTYIFDWGAAGMNGKHPSEPLVEIIPDYLNDLNAMHKAKKILSDSQKRKWGELCVEMTNDFPQHIVLYCKNSVSGENIYTVANLTAAQEAELLLKTLGLWEEEE